jgi:hypothetical protein
MLADLLPYLNVVDWTDETVLKAVKDLACGNISLTEFDQVVSAHERRFKLAALLKRQADP